MKPLRPLFFTTLLICSFGLALASQLDFVNTLPVNRPLSQSTLDDPQPDTLRYDDGNPQFLWPGANYWIRVAFTAPDTFELRSIYFYTTNFPNVAGPCSVWVHENSGGQLGDVLSVYTQPTLLDGGFNDGNLPTPITFNPGDNFFVVLGPVPGGDQQVAWVPMIDGASTGHGALGTTGHYGTYDPAVPGDWMVRCGGAVAAYTDLTATECWNIIGGDAPSFNLLPGSDVLLYTNIENIGSEDVTTFTVTWTIVDPDGINIYTETSIGDALAAGASMEVVAPNSIALTDPGEYIATAECFTPEDGVFVNNSVSLRFFVGDTPRWFRYDDDEANTHINPSQGTSWGVSYMPPSYPASIESLRVEFGGDGDAAVAIYLNDPTSGTPTGTAIWDAAPTVVTGWNVIAVDPPVDIFDGQSFTVATSWSEDAVSTGKDDTPPNEAGITNMPGVGWQGFNGEWAEDLGGNWCIQVYMDSSNAVPPWPVFVSSTTAMSFGDVPINRPDTMTFWVFNEGNVEALNVTATSIVPPAAAAVYSFDPTTYSVAAGDSQEVTVVFSPTNIGQNYNGLVTITNNSQNEPSFRLTVSGTGDDPVSAAEPMDGLPKEFALAQNYPNPFNPSTQISFALPVPSNVRLTVYNTLGRQVAVLMNGAAEAGVHTLDFRADGLSAGLYFYKLEAGSFTETRKMMLLK